MKVIFKILLTVAMFALPVVSYADTVTSYRRELFDVPTTTIAVPVITGDILNIWSSSQAACGPNSIINAIDIANSYGGSTTTVTQTRTTTARGCFATTNYVYSVTGTGNVYVDGYDPFHLTTATNTLMILKVTPDSGGGSGTTTLSIDQDGIYMGFAIFIWILVFAGCILLVRKLTD